MLAGGRGGRCRKNTLELVSLVALPRGARVRWEPHRHSAWAAASAPPAKISESGLPVTVLPGKRLYCERTDQANARGDDTRYGRHLTISRRLLLEKKVRAAHPDSRRESRRLRVYTAIKGSLCSHAVR